MEMGFTTAASRGDEQNSYTCFVEEVKREKDSTLAGETEGNELEQFLENIRRVLATRKIRLQDREENEGKDDPNDPFYACSRRPARFDLR